MPGNKEDKPERQIKKEKEEKKKCGGRRKGVRKSSRLMEKPKGPPLTEIGSKSSGR